MAMALGVPEADSLPALLAAKGIDPNAPMGLYVDTGPLETALDEAAALIEEIAARRESAAEAAPEDAAGAEGTEAPPGADLEMELQMAMAQAMGSVMANLPRVALVLHVTDAEKARGTAGQLALMAASNNPNIDVSKPPEETADGTTTYYVYAPDAFAYAVDGTRMVCGTSLDIVQAVAAGMAAPRAVRYGTDAWPAVNADELAALIYPNRLTGLMESMDRVMTAAAESGLMPEGSGMPSTGLQGPWLEQFRRMYGESDEPILVSLALSEEKFEFVSQIDLTSHPEAAAMAGQPGPMEYAGLMPGSTAALIGLRLTPEIKTQITQTFDQMAAAGASDPELARMAGMVKVIANLIDAEVAVGITGVQPAMPELLGYVELADVALAKGYLEVLGFPLTSETRHNDIPIMEAPIELPMPLRYAFSENVLVVSNDETELHAALDRLAADAPPNILETLVPPIDPERARYAVVYLDTGLIPELMKALAPAEVAQAAPAEQVVSVVRQVRMVSEIDEHVQEQRLSVYFN